MVKKDGYLMKTTKRVPESKIEVRQVNEDATCCPQILTVLFHGPIILVRIHLAENPLP